MKSSTLFALSLPLLSTHAWTFTWRDAEGKKTVESGHGPSKCIPIHHAKGQEFDMDGEGEPNINMLLFANNKCSGEPSGQASVSFVKDASSDLSGFQVVPLDGDDEDETFTLPTVSATSTSSSSDSDETTSATQTASSSGADSTETNSASGSNSDAVPSPSESGQDATPTDGSAKLGLSRTGIAGVVVAVVAGGWALDLLF